MGYTSLIVGVLCCVALFQFLRYLYRFLSFNALPNFKKYGQWAVVTGSTDGIGKAYAEILAGTGLDIVLISRTLSKLQTVASEIESKYKVKTKIIAADFTKSDIYEGIKKELEGLDVGVLINNVGMSYKYPEYLAEMPNGDDYCMQMINCNLVSATMMCRMLLNQMVEKNKGLIINVSSISGSFPCPLLSIYAATKAYLDSFSQGIASEYKNRGVTIHVVLPGYVTTNMSGIKRASLAVPTPSKFAETSLKRCEWTTRSGGYWYHDMLLLGLSFLTAFLPFCRDHILLTHLGRNREKVLKRYAEKNRQD